MLKWAAIAVCVAAGCSRGPAAATPVRFAQVAPRLYRGGEPSAAQLGELYARGVRTIIDLRDSPESVAAEAAVARQLGMRHLNFPFSGFSEPESSLLRRIVDAMTEPGSDGAVYVHCRAGRDRTSLVVALYRVWVDAWAPAEAWRREADGFGHGGWRHVFFRKLDRAFEKLTVQADAS